MHHMLLIFIFYISSYASQSITNVNDFIYYNSGTTTKSQTYQLVEVTSIYNEGYLYKDDLLGSNVWSTNNPLTYLFETYKNGTIGTPSSGLRSSVFMGPIGQSGFEMRGDGRLTDFTIFNNAPNAKPSAFAHKYDLNEAVFGFTFKNAHISASKIFQTSPLDENMLPFAINSLSYSGSYPVSRLIGTDDEFSAIGINSVRLTAFSSFEPLNIDMSSIPAVIFWFEIDNSHNAHNVTMDFFFNWQDIINIDSITVNEHHNGWIMNKLFDLLNPLYFTAGNMSFTVQECSDTNECNSRLKGDIIYSANSTLHKNWMQFIQNTNIQKDIQNTTDFGHYAFSVKDITIPAKSKYKFSAVLSWFFPYRTFNGNQQYLGHYYNNFYASAQQVNEDVLKKLATIIQNIASWHQLWKQSMSSMYPDFLKDIYLNAPAYISRTGFLLESETNATGIWRQSESWSCFQIDPPHIHQYRSLAYNLIFGNVLDRGTLNMYTYGEIDDGLVSESFAYNKTMGKPAGGKRGDDNSLYILGIYSQFKWYTDGVKYVSKRFAYVKDAMNWIINESIPNGYGVPYRLVNTNDEHGVIGDINTYNSMIYISALYAMKVMTQFYEASNTLYLKHIDEAISFANGNVSKYLWEPAADGFYRSFWCANGQFSPYALQSDVLYGYLWALILDLDEYFILEVNISSITQHLEEELKRNWSQYGLIFMSNRSTEGYNCAAGGYNNNKKFQDIDTWEKDTLDFAAISLFVNQDKYREWINIAKVGLDKYRELFHDQWDVRDTSSTYDDSDPEYSRPVVNSHYARQLIEFSMILALNGQKLNVDPFSAEMTLIIKPIVSLNGDNGCLPILLPQCTFLLCLDATANSNCFEISGLFGEVLIHQLSITNSEIMHHFTSVNISKDSKKKLCFE